MNEAGKLCQETLPGLSGRARIPAYDRGRCGIGVVHLGLGAFHRAHQAVYFDDILQQQAADWAISGVSLRSPGVRDQMSPQDGLYTLVELNGPQMNDRVIGSVRESLFLGDQRPQVLARLADSQTHLISLTVTEKAYCLASLDGGLDTGHPGIIRDLRTPEDPVTLPGLLTQGLAKRRELRSGAPTVLSCDNLPGNGRKLRRAILEFAEICDPELARWIETEVAFPCTMVDRIVPKTVAEDREQLASRLGVRDDAMVKAEPFSQWVIEDRFSGPVPDLRHAGALLVDDVDAYEELKLRLLLGAHSTIAYLGCLAGYRYVHQAMDSPIGVLVAEMMTREIEPVTDAPPGFDVDDYRERLLGRFRNSGLRHECRQIAMDGSLKVPIRLLDTVSRCLSRNVPCDRLGLGIAAWIRYATGIAEDGSPVVIDDPAAETLTRIGLRVGLDPALLVDEFLNIDSIFTPYLAENMEFTNLIKKQLSRLLRIGAKEAARL